jgi:predicted nuclease with TOPRIM domain
MLDIEHLIARVWELEGKYDELLRNHQSLIHEYEELKAKYEKACVGHRNIDGSPYDTLGNH